MNRGCSWLKRSYSSLTIVVAMLLHGIANLELSRFSSPKPTIHGLDGMVFTVG